MTIGDRLRHDADHDHDPVDADALIRRVRALDRFARAAARSRVPAEDLSPATDVVARAGGRLALSRDHTVVALAGATGSGKSSLFNRLAGMELSDVGVRRPTTGVTHACVWGEEGAAPLLDWLRVPPDRRFVRESVLDAEDQVALRGLVLLDLPDFDSIEERHRDEVDRLVRLADLIVWVTDPQKYADQVVHERYLRAFRHHRESTLVVLNQADRLSAVDVDRCLTDLRSLLACDGLDGVPVFATSATSTSRVEPLAESVRATVAERMAALRRLAADVTAATERLAPLVDGDLRADAPAPDAIERLNSELSTAAGVPGVAEAARRAYRLRAGASTSWLGRRWLRRSHADPLRRLRADMADAQPSLDAGSEPATPEPAARSASLRARAALAVRAFSDRSGTGLPAPWQVAIDGAARSHEAELPAALDRVVIETDLSADRKPPWWRLIGLAQWLIAVIALAGAVWLLAHLGFAAIGLPLFDIAHVGPLPLAAVLLAGGLVAGVLLDLLARPFAAAGSRRAERRAHTRLRAAIAEVANGRIVAPVRASLDDYAEARQAWRDASRR